MNYDESVIDKDLAEATKAPRGARRREQEAEQGN